MVRDGHALPQQRGGGASEVISARLTPSNASEAIWTHLRPSQRGEGETAAGEGAHEIRKPPQLVAHGEDLAPLSTATLPVSSLLSLTAVWPPESSLSHDFSVKMRPRSSGYQLTCSAWPTSSTDIKAFSAFCGC